MTGVSLGEQLDKDMQGLVTEGFAEQFRNTYGFAKVRITTEGIDALRSLEAELPDAVKQWRDVREKIFSYNGIPPLALWDELGDAEQALMKLARELE